MFDKTKNRVCFFTNPWQSGEIRGRQIASELAKRGYNTTVDPDKLWATDVLVAVKCSVSDEIYNHVGRLIVDVVDSGGVISWLRGHEKAELIAISETAKTYLASEVTNRKIWLIPEHHCNWEGTRVIAAKPTVAGYLGSREGFQLNPDDLAKCLVPTGIRFFAFDNEMARNRQEVCDFYRRIDIQICFRKCQPHPELKNPLKVANAGSFGIPTIAYPEPGYKELEGEYISANSLDAIVWNCDQLVRVTGSYTKWSTAALTASTRYSISRIVDLYEEMLNGSSDKL